MTRDQIEFLSSCPAYCNTNTTTYCNQPIIYLFAQKEKKQAGHEGGSQSTNNFLFCFTFKQLNLQALGVGCQLQRIRIKESMLLSQGSNSKSYTIKIVSDTVHMVRPQDERTGRYSSKQVVKKSEGDKRISDYNKDGGHVVAM